MDFYSSSRGRRRAFSFARDNGDVVFKGGDAPAYLPDLGLKKVKKSLSIYINKKAVIFFSQGGLLQAYSVKDCSDVTKPPCRPNNFI